MIIYNGLYYVYAHINMVNGKIYIGMSKRRNPNARWKNGKGYEYNWHFDSAIKKYGWDKFEHIIIASNLTEKEASNMERLLINCLNTTSRQHGYNFAEGGYNNRSLKGELNPFYGIVPEKAVQASIAKRKGKPLSEETKEKIRQGNIRAGINPNSMRALQESWKINKNKATGSRNKKSVAVMCIETNQIFESQRIAESQLGLPRGSVYQAMKCNIKVNGYHFKRVLNSNDQSKDVGLSEPKWRDA